MEFKTRNEAPEMVTLTIDGMEVQAPKGASILQACESVGIEIPRFCYHDRLSVPANCRMCLVEVEKARKPVPSCAESVRDGLVVYTRSQQTREARKAVMEMLLINHPLDCPICDQGGECDLQDQAVAYGFDRGRYAETKRAVEDKDLGPLVKTIMTRCIHCTRCVRFMDEIAGTGELCMTSRGEESEIGTYVGGPVTSELSGNIIDICPVGALTNKPYAYAARPWELRKTETIDVMDAVGTNIRVDVRGANVLRAMPILNEEVNEEWLADKGRFAVDGLLRRRLDRPYIRRNGKLVPADWDEALAAAAAALSTPSAAQIAALIGDQCDAESMKALKDLMAGLGVANVDCRQDGATYDVSTPAAYQFNSTIAGIEEADAVLLVGTFPRWEAPLINARIRKTWLARQVPVGVIGEAGRDHTYPVVDLGNDSEALSALAEGRGAFFDTLQQAKRPLIIVGAGALARPDGLSVQAKTRALAEAVGAIDEAAGWIGYSVLQLAAARTGALALGLTPGDGGRTTAEILEGARQGALKTVYLLAADEIDTTALKDCFVIYQGHHGDAGAHVADVILPGAAYTEKQGLYVNTEGRCQQARAASFPRGEAREDWKILRALSGVLGQPLPYDSLVQVRDALAADNLLFDPAHWDQAPEPVWAPFGSDHGLQDAPFLSPVANYYKTCAISRASETMEQCTQTLLMETSAARKTS